MRISILLILFSSLTLSGDAGRAEVLRSESRVGSLGAEVSNAEIAPARAVLMSPVFAGWGQLYADNDWRAVLAFGAEAYYLSHVLMNDRRAKRLQAYNQGVDGSPDQAYRDQVAEYRELVHDNAWRAIGALFFITVDAFVGAHLHRFDADPQPVPDNWEPGEIPQPIELPTAISPQGIVLLNLKGRF